MEIREVTYLAVVLRILAAVIIGGLLGLERGLKNRAAGLRTYMLVCVGSCLIMLTNHYIYQTFGSGDPVRMGAQVVSGIGFLGAGTIIVTRRSQIKGLTTAAGLWSSAGIGLALGVGFYEAAVIGAFAVFAVMTLLQKLDNRMHHKSKVVDVYIELNEKLTLGEFLRQVRNMDLDVGDVEREYDTDPESGDRAYTATIKAKTRRNRAELLEKIQALPGVEYLEEM